MKMLHFKQVIVMKKSVFTNLEIFDRIFRKIVFTFHFFQHHSDIFLNFRKVETMLVNFSTSFCKFFYFIVSKTSLPVLVNQNH